MSRLQKVGGVAALFEAFTYVVGFSVLATLLNPGDVEGWGAIEKLAYVLQKQDLFQAWIILIYAIFGLVLVVLAVALHERLKAGSVAMMQVATAFGLIWAGFVIASGMVTVVGLEASARIFGSNPEQAASLWIAIGTVQDGLGGGVEIVGGLWVLLISIVSLRTGGFPKALNYLGLLVGASGVLTIVPPLGDLGMAFGLGQILWFAFIGITMLRQPAPRIG
jgi:hypothetical protein